MKAVDDEPSQTFRWGLANFECSVFKSNKIPKVSESFDMVPV
jgi:hypothetical protein